MLPVFLITFREVIEASIIVATVLGILVKFHQSAMIKTVWTAVGAAALLSILLLGIGSLLGLQVQELYEKNEAYIEGILMTVSALFITWTVFFLHDYFMHHKIHFFHKIKKSAKQREKQGLFILVFTAVFREGFEIFLFLSTIYFSSNPQQIFSGFIGGLIFGLIVSLVVFKTTTKMSAQYAFKISSFLLILFAAGLLARAVHEFVEVGMMPEIGKMTFRFIPQNGFFIADMLKSIFGITQHMDLVQLSVYTFYTILMSWYVFLRKTSGVHV